MPTTPPIPSTLGALLEAEAVPQLSFPWRPQPWKDHLHDAPEIINVLDRMPERVDRESTRQLVQTELEAGRTLAAFVTAMVWGYGTAGYGPIRTRWILTGTKTASPDAPLLQSVGEKLLAGAVFVRENGAIEGFRFMNNNNRIKHLGAAYFTKWLYFASAIQGSDDPDAAPILDAQVVQWLTSEVDFHFETAKTESYERYVSLLTAWGAEYNRAPVQVEKSIFSLATGRG